MAVLTTVEYAALHGGTVASVMLSRVNSVFYRETGVFFELIESNDLLVCLPSDTTCNGWPNAEFLAVKTREFMGERGVSPNMYNIGHGLITRRVGVASFSSLCIDDYKARAVTSMDSIEEPYLIIRLVNHVAKQLGAPNTHRNCNGEFDGVEPGGGQSLMGSIVPCTSDKTHSVKETFFHSTSFYYILTFVENTTCRESFSFQTLRPPSLGDQYRTCAVPKGNHVQWSGEVAEDNSGGLKYSWERVNFGYEPYQDTDVPRFRPWAPRSSVSRFLPNMYYLTYGLGSQLDELPPKATVPGELE